MAYKIKITPTAFNDLQNSIDYYNKQQKGLGIKFNNVIQITFIELKKEPASGSFIYDSVRYKVIKKIPYIILYDLSIITPSPFTGSLILSKTLFG